MQENISPGQRFVNVLNQTRAAVLRASERPEERGIHIGQAVHLVRGDLMVCARAVMTRTVADRLAGLCEYMCARLGYAETHNVDAPFLEVIRLIDDLRRASPSLDRTRALAGAGKEMGFS